MFMVNKLNFLIKFISICYDHKTVTDKETYKVDEKERYRGAEVFDPVPGLKRNVVSFRFCITLPKFNYCQGTTVLFYFCRQ